MPKLFSSIAKSIGTACCVITFWRVMIGMIYWLERSNPGLYIRYILNTKFITVVVILIGISVTLLFRKSYFGYPIKLGYYNVLVPSGLTLICILYVWYKRIVYGIDLENPHWLQENYIDMFFLVQRISIAVPFVTTTSIHSLLKHLPEPRKKLVPKSGQMFFFVKEAMIEIENYGPYRYFVSAIRFHYLVSVIKTLFV
jgi:hypothetical protein